jgi:hypothetical protein
MSGDRNLTLTPELQEAKRETKALIRAAGGQEACEEMTGRAQSRFSDYGSRNTGSFMPIDLVEKLEGVTHGKPGHPNVTRWLARRAGFMLVERPKVGAGGAWGRSLQDLGREFGQVSGAVCGALGDPDTPGEVTADEVRDHRILENLDELAELVARMRAMAVQVVEAEGR